MVPAGRHAEVPPWYDHLIGMQMSDRGDRGVLVASPDAATYKLKLLGSTRPVLVTIEQALRARRIQLDGLTVTLGDLGTGIVRTQDPKHYVLPGFSSNALVGMCGIDWTHPIKTPPHEVPFADVLVHARDPYIGVSLKKTYDDTNRVYKLTVSKRVVDQGALHYDATFDDGDVDRLPKEDVLESMNPDDLREIIVRYEDVVAPPPITALPPLSRPLLPELPPVDAASTNLVHVRFHGASIHMVLGHAMSTETPPRPCVTVHKLLQADDGSPGEAEASGLVDVGDIVASINGLSVRGFHIDRIVSIVSQSPRPIQLSFRKNGRVVKARPPPARDTTAVPFQAAPSAVLPAPSVLSSERQLAMANGWSAVMLDLRDAITHRRVLQLDGGRVVCFADGSPARPLFDLPASTCTGFCGKFKPDAPLPLGALAMYAKHRHLSYAEYLRMCRTNEVEIVSVTDINALQPFLNGRNDPAPGLAPSRPAAAFKMFTHDVHVPCAPVEKDDTSPPPPIARPAAESPSSVRTIAAAVPVTPTKDDGDDSSDDEPLRPKKHQRRPKKRSAYSQDDSTQSAATPPKRTKPKSSHSSTTSSAPATTSTDLRVVTVNVHDVGLRVSLQEHPGSRYAVVGSFKRGPRGERGEVETSGVVRVGAELTHVSSTHVARMTISAVVDLIKLVRRPTTFTFRNPEES